MYVFSSNADITGQHSFNGKTPVHNVKTVKSEEILHDKSIKVLSRKRTNRHIQVYST